MRLSKIITNKFIALLAILIGLLQLGPGIAKGFTVTMIVKTIFWFLGGVFAWQRKVWASILLSMLALYYLVDDVILQLPKFGEIFAVSPSDAEVFGIYASIITIFSILLEVVIMLCIIYYGLCSAKHSGKS